MSRRILIDDDAAQYENINARLRRLEQGIPEDVRYVGATGEPVFQNGWTNLDGAAPPTGRAAAYYRDRGRVYLTGIITNGTSSTTAFLLPVGYRPLAQSFFSELLAMSSAGPAEVRIFPSGAVTPMVGGAGTWCALDGLSFRHA